MEKLYKMFEEIALPFSGGKCLEYSKEKKILEILKEYNPQYVDGIGIIVPSITEKPKKIIVSHIDLVYPFQNGFLNGKIFELKNDKLYGALDNTLTNAFLILAIKELRDNGLAQDVQFLFTEGEETGMTGMSNYMQYIYPKLDNPFFINLDVTNDNFGYIGSIEYDYPNKNICKQIFDYSNNIGFTNQRFPDDTSVIINYTKKALSYCVPTDEYCHTYNSNCIINYLEPYYNGLLYLIKDLNIDNVVYDINILNNTNIKTF